MSPTRLRSTIAVAAVVVVACGAAVFALYPHRAVRELLPPPRGLRLVKHTSTVGTRCFLDDDRTGRTVRTPYRCGVTPQFYGIGGDDALSLEGSAGSTVEFCVFDRVRARDLACWRNWLPAWMRVSPARVVVVDREATHLDVIWIERATGARHAERADWMASPKHVVREHDARGRVWSIGESHLELGGDP